MEVDEMPELRAASSSEICSELSAMHSGCHAPSLFAMHEIHVLYYRVINSSCSRSIDID